MHASSERPAPPGTCRADRGPARAPRAACGCSAALDYLILADSPLIVDTDGHVHAIADERTAHLPDYSTEGVRAARNSPGGFYVASTKPDAAYKAIRGTLPTTTVRRAALLSDGAARLVERFGVIDWPELLDLLATDGPDELIQRTRQAELAETDPERATRRGKKHDDATAVLVTHIHDVRSADPSLAATTSRTHSP